MHRYNSASLNCKLQGYVLSLEVIISKAVARGVAYNQTSGAFPVLVIRSSIKSSLVVLSFAMELVSEKDYSGLC